MKGPNDFPSQFDEPSMGKRIKETKEKFNTLFDFYIKFKEGGDIIWPGYLEQYQLEVIRKELSKNGWALEGMSYSGQKVTMMIVPYISYPPLEK